MNTILKILLEQLRNISLINRLAAFDIKSKYQMHYLGTIWQVLNPTIQVLIYWFVFGVGIRGGSSVGEVPFFVWLLVGLVPWFFISPTIIQGSNSVYSKVNLVSKMKFPVSLLPTIVLWGNGFNFIIMLGVLEVILLINGIFPTIFLVQLPYYLIALFLFLFSCVLLFSTLSTLVRDFQLLLQSVMRMLLYLSPILWVTSQLPSSLHKILMLNPFYYLIDGFRMTFLGEGWFFENIAYTMYFWVLTIFILLLGSYIHEKFKSQFVDYL